MAADDPLVGRSVAEAIRKPKHSDDGSGDEEDEFNGDDEKPLDDDDDEETDADNEDEEDDDLNGENGDTDDIDKKDSNRSTDMKDDFEEDTEDETIDTHEKPTHKTDPMGPSGGELEGSGDGEDDENDDEDDDKLDTDDEESGATNHKFNIAGSNMPTKAPSDNLKPDTTLVTSGPELKKPSIPIEVDRPRLNSEETDDHSQPKPPTHTTATDDEDEDDGDKDKDDREDDKDEDETEKPIVPPKTIDTTTFDHHDNNRVDNSRIDSARPETPTWSSRPDWTSQSVPPSRPIDTTNDNSILVFGRHNWANTVSLFAQPTILAGKCFSFPTFYFTLLSTSMSTCFLDYLF